MLLAPLTGIIGRLVRYRRHYKGLLLTRVKQFLDLSIAFPAVAAYAEAFEKLPARTQTAVDGCLDLSVGDCLADAYIHESIP